MNHTPKQSMISKSFRSTNITIFVYYVDIQKMCRSLDFIVQVLRLKLYASAVNVLSLSSENEMPVLNTRLSKRIVFSHSAV